MFSRYWLPIKIDGKFARLLVNTPAKTAAKPACSASIYKTLVSENIWSFSIPNLIIIRFILKVIAYFNSEIALSV